MTLRHPSEHPAQSASPAPGGPPGSPGSAPPSGRRAWIGLAVLALPALLASLELTVTHLALPTIGTQLGASSTQQLWIVDIYAFMLAGSMLAMGSVGDRIGRRRLLLTGAAVFAAASSAAAYAPNAETLIALRAVMGVSGATLMPSVLALTAALFPDRSRRRVAVGAVIAAVSGGTAVGPLVGGWLLEHFWWGSVFLIGVPVMALLLLLGPWLLPETGARPQKRVDVVSALLTVGTVLPLVYALKRFGAGEGGGAGLLLVAAGAMMGVAFVRRQRRLDAPMVDPALFRNPAFTVTLAALALGIFVLWGANYATAQYLQLVEGLTPLRAGLWTAPAAAGVIVGSTLAPHLARRVGTGTTVGGGLAVAAVGFAVLAQVGAGGDLASLVTGSVIVSAGLGPMMALATERIVSSAPEERAGSASAMASMAPQLGGALGIAVLGSVITATYRHRMDDAVPPGTPNGPADAARDNLADAVDTAKSLPAPTNSDVLEAARQAFAGGLRLSAAISCAIAGLLAFATLRFLPSRRDEQEAGAAGNT